MLANQKALENLQRAWTKADSWLVGKFVVMPDQVHLFCTPANPESPELVKWVSFWKSESARTWPWPDHAPLWQRQFWDTRIRTAKHYEDRWAYVHDNPKRAGLIKDAEEWPWTGEVNWLPWR
ncbi:MAG: hypothetical protein JSS66_02975 [Armatimonadetes bacterium]|nr:hypothetical protein [Armatimonadota bacterium]